MMSEDLDLVKKMGLKARTYAEKVLNWPVILNRTLNFYERVLSSEGA